MGQRMSIRSRRELVRVTYERYQRAKGTHRGQILDEFIAATGYHRKYAIEVLLHPPRLTPRVLKRKRRRFYGVMVKHALVSVWKTANCICSKRLIPFLPELLEVLEQHGELALEPEVKEKLLKMSTATADRLLEPERKKLAPRGKCTTKPGTLLRRQIPVRTFADWNEQKPGFVEADLVAHCDDDGSGEFLHSLVMTDVMTGWTECVSVLNKGQMAVFAGIELARVQLPFPLLGLDSDNGGEFINGHLSRYCTEEKITFTRCRPYHKNDQCHVEGKNWSIVRRMVGYDRYEGAKACKALAELYEALRLYENFFQPCMKLLEKERVNTRSDQATSDQATSDQATSDAHTGRINGTRIRKKYDAAKTPYQRVMESEHVSKESKDRLREQYQSLNPRQLLDQVHELQNRLWMHSKAYRPAKQG